MTVVVLSPARPGRYDVRLCEEVIVRGSRDPEHDAARALLARGITGPMTTMRANGMVCMHFASIEKTARLTVVRRPRGRRSSLEAICYPARRRKGAFVGAGGC